MRSIEKLREYAPNHTELYAVCNAAADEIEAEIAERYMELPTDADGVPIHVGDVVGSDYEVPTEVTGMECVMSVADEPWWILYWGNPNRYGSEDSDWGTFADQPKSYRHVKPRTLEDVLQDLIDAAAEIHAHALDDDMPDMLDNLIGEYTDKVREAVESE